jgi:hypothetical protein
MGPGAGAVTPATALCDARKKYKQAVKASAQFKILCQDNILRVIAAQS